ncbi:MAG TPA: hypothetical protein VF251_06505, partial [Pyrinomonadaceae bacterium]
MRTSAIANLLFLAFLPSDGATWSRHLHPGGLNLGSVPIPPHVQAPGPITKIGAFSNMRYTSEHAY